MAPAEAPAGSTTDIVSQLVSCISRGEIALTAAIDCRCLLLHAAPDQALLMSAMLVIAYERLHCA